MGLYIVKSIIEHSGGKVWFKSPAFAGKTSAAAKVLTDKPAGREEDKGTEFYFTLPLTGMKKKEGARAPAPR